MPSNSPRPVRLRGQAGFGLIEALVGSVMLAVAVVVLLGSLSSVLVGARIAERRTSEERLAASRLESLLGGPFTPSCNGFQPGPSTDSAYPGYTITAACAPDGVNPNDPNAPITYTVTVSRESDAVQLSDLRAPLP